MSPPPWSLAVVVALLAASVPAQSAQATCSPRISFIDLTHSSQAQVLDFRPAVATAWHTYLAAEPVCLQAVTSQQMALLQDSSHNTTVDGLEHLLHAIAYALPSSIASKNSDKTIETLGLISQVSNEVTDSLKALGPIVYPLDLGRKQKCAQDRLFASTDRAVWSSISKGLWWFPLITDPVPRDSSAQATFSRDIATLRSTRLCTEAVDQLNLDLSCSQEDYRRLLDALRGISGLLNEFMDDTKPEDNDLKVGPAWGSAYEVRLRGICTDFLMLFGVVERLGLERCITGPKGPS